MLPKGRMVSQLALSQTMSDSPTVLLVTHFESTNCFYGQRGTNGAEFAIFLANLAEYYSRQIFLECTKLVLFKKAYSFHFFHQIKKKFNAFSSFVSPIGFLKRWSPKSLSVRLFVTLNRGFIILMDFYDYPRSRDFYIFEKNVINL